MTSHCSQPRVRAGALASLTLALFVADACAGIPTPNWSTVDARLTVCPAGDMAFHLIPRRGTAPVPGANVSIELCASLGWAACTSGQPAEIVMLRACQPSVFTDINGLATLAWKAGGTTADSTVALWVDGVSFGHRFLASPDQNGDLIVDLGDDAILVSKLGRHDLSADFDGDGVVTEADRLILRQHLGHGCEMATPAKGTPWGEVKQRYR